MPRLLRLTPAYLSSARQLGVGAGTAASRDVLRVLRALEGAGDLEIPGPASKRLELPRQRGQRRATRRPPRPSGLRRRGRLPHGLAKAHERVAPRACRRASLMTTSYVALGNSFRAFQVLVSLDQYWSARPSVTAPQSVRQRRFRLLTCERRAASVRARSVTSEVTSTWIA